MSMSIFSQGWEAIGRIIIMSILCYSFLILTLRISGKRTLSKLNAFDLVITVALGSTFASSLTSKNVGILDAFTIFAMLASLQFVVSWLAVRFERFNRIIKSEHKMLFYKGEFLFSEMKKERVTKEEILTAIRKNGLLAPEEVIAVILESSGEFSVIPQPSKSKPN